MILNHCFRQHIFCPIMPPSLMDYCCAPMPFLMGVHESLMKVQVVMLKNMASTNDICVCYISILQNNI